VIDQFEFNYTGLNGVRSRCNIMMFSDDGEHFICFEDLGMGVSVTNASEILATQVVNTHDLNPDDCRFFETYRQYGHDTIDEIEYTWKKNEGSKKLLWEARVPRWKPAGEEIRELFLG